MCINFHKAYQALFSYVDTRRVSQEKNQIKFSQPKIEFFLFNKTEN